MTKHDAAVNLFHACEILKKIRTLSSNEIDRLAEQAFILVRDTGDSLYPEIIEEYRRKSVDVMA